MKIVLRTTFTINNGDENTRDLEVVVPSGKEPAQMDTLELMSLAADTLVARGQVMVCGAEIAA